MLFLLPPSSFDRLGLILSIKGVCASAAWSHPLGVWPCPFQLTTPWKYPNCFGVAGTADHIFSLTATFETSPFLWQVVQVFGKRNRQHLRAGIGYSCQCPKISISILKRNWQSLIVQLQHTYWNYTIDRVISIMIFSVEEVAHIPEESENIIMARLKR